MSATWWAVSLEVLMLITAILAGLNFAAGRAAPGGAFLVAAVTAGATAIVLLTVGRGLASWVLWLPVVIGVGCAFRLVEPLAWWPLVAAEAGVVVGFVGSMAAGLPWWVPFGYAAVAVWAARGLRPDRPGRGGVHAHS